MTSSADSDIGAGTLAVHRLYRHYLVDANITFDELLIIAQLHDGSEHEVTHIASELRLDPTLMSSSIANLERGKYIEQIYPSSSRAASIRLVSDTKRIAERLLVIQANVDIDLCIVSEQISQLRRSLLLLARRTSKRAAMG